jgi:subfamily B ATP-binding cassette protein MsbA
MITVPTLFVLVVLLRKLGKRIRRGTRGSLHAQQGLLRIATEALQGLRAVKANTGEEETIERFDDVNRDVVRHELRVRTARAASSPMVETLAVMAFMGLVLVAAKLIIGGRLDPQQFMTALIALGVAGGSFRPLAGLVTEIQAASAPAARLCEILDQQAEEDAGAERATLTRHKKHIEFDFVSFAYPESDRPALRDISLRIEHGEKVALVGPNGSGKTTLVSLLPRLLTPDSGRVKIDGTDIAGVSLQSLRRQIGVVTQETVLFRGSIAENIAFGLNGVGREQIVDAARRAHADGFITEIPEGYDADLAEQGASLSGGQRQRLTIARAILRDPTILILDEATSQIDAESEAQINAALTEFCEGRTSLIVAHRLATVLNADRIVVMDEGRIIEQGTHEDLLQRCDLYRRLTETQLVSGST